MAIAGSLSAAEQNVDDIAASSVNIWIGQQRINGRSQYWQVAFDGAP
jgi:hypothetical protein